MLVFPGRASPGVFAKVQIKTWFSIFIPLIAESIIYVHIHLAKSRFWQNLNFQSLISTCIGQVLN